MKRKHCKFEMAQAKRTFFPDACFAFDERYDFQKIVMNNIAYKSLLFPSPLLISVYFKQQMRDLQRPYQFQIITGKIFTLSRTLKEEKKQKMSTDNNNKKNAFIYRNHIKCKSNGNRKRKKKTNQRRIILHTSTLTVFSQSLMLIIKASLYVTKFVKMRSVCVTALNIQSNGVCSENGCILDFGIPERSRNENGKRKMNQIYRLKPKI